MSELKKLNFEKLISIDFEKDVAAYSFKDYQKNNGHNIKGFCTLCEQNNIHISPKDSSFQLQNISHGASSEDFFDATDTTLSDLDDTWKSEGVVFIMESPSVDWGFYEKQTIEGISKKPTNEWYWVHDTQEKYQYPQEFKGGRYGSLFNSIIFTFKLKNAYITNLVKCGMNNSEGKFKGLEFFDGKCVDTCFQHFLKAEISILKPKVIFCFGSMVLNNFIHRFKDENIKVISLPNPAGRRRGFKDEYYRHLYFTKILEGLFEAGIYSMEESKDKFEDFLWK